MVYLSKIYTKGGDNGHTSLGDGARVSKAHPRINAIGEVDELNCVIGLALSALREGHNCFKGTHIEIVASERLRKIQNDLFDLGADLCLPLSENNKLRIHPTQVTQLEKWLDEYNADLQPLKSFILPGGSLFASYCHLARAVCRRAERAVVTLADMITVNPQVMIYLNRLSDYLFVLARFWNNGGKDDILWKPGGNQEQEEE